MPRVLEKEPITTQAEREKIANEVKARRKEAVLREKYKHVNNQWREITAKYNTIHSAISPFISADDNSYINMYVNIEGDICDVLDIKSLIVFQSSGIQKLILAHYDDIDAATEVYHMVEYITNYMGWTHFVKLYS